MGNRSGYFDALGQALLQTMKLDEPSFTLELQTTTGAGEDVEAIQQGRADCGFSFANLVYESSAGRLLDQPKSLNHLRGVALVQISPLYLLAGRQSSIRSIADLRGQTIASGVPGGGTSRAAMLVLQAYGLGAHSIHIQEESLSASFARLKSGSLAGLFLLAGQPSALVSRLTERDARIVPLFGPALDRLREQYPFLRPALIPAGTYPFQESPVRTVGVESLLLCRDDLGVGEVRHLTEKWFVTSDRLIKDGKLSDAVSPRVASATPIPLHAGAAEYYRARQLMPE